MNSPSLLSRLYLDRRTVRGYSFKRGKWLKSGARIWTRALALQEGFSGRQALVALPLSLRSYPMIPLGRDPVDHIWCFCCMCEAQLQGPELAGVCLLFLFLERRGFHCKVALACPACHDPGPSAPAHPWVCTLRDSIAGEMESAIRSAFSGADGDFYRSAWRIASHPLVSVELVMRIYLEQRVNLPNALRWKRACFREGCSFGGNQFLVCDCCFRVQYCSRECFDDDHLCVPWQTVWDESRLSLVYDTWRRPGE